MNMNFFATEYFKLAMVGVMRQPLPNITLPGPSKINPHNQAAGIVPKMVPKPANIVPQFKAESSDKLIAPKIGSYSGFPALAYFAALG
jgi:hypothetical protein